MFDAVIAAIPQNTFGILLTIAAYGFGLWLYRRSGYQPLLQPVIIGVILVMLCLWWLHIPYPQYFQSAAIIHTLLGTATVALAIPLYQNLPRIRQHMLPLLVTLAVTGIVAAATAVGFAWVMGADRAVLLSLAPKSITTPFAIGVSQLIGGYPALTAACVIFTGMVVAAMAEPLFRKLRIHDPIAQGTAMGMIGHGIGTARALQLHPQSGAFSALSMGLMGLYTSVYLPWAVRGILQSPHLQHLLEFTH